MSKSTAIAIVVITLTLSLGDKFVQAQTTDGSQPTLDSWIPRIVQPKGNPLSNFKKGALKPARRCPLGTVPIVVGTTHKCRKRVNGKVLIGQACQRLVNRLRAFNSAPKSGWNGHWYHAIATTVTVGGLWCEKEAKLNFFRGRRGEDGITPVREIRVNPKTKVREQRWVYPGGKKSPTKWEPVQQVIIQKSQRGQKGEKGEPGIASTRIDLFAALEFAGILPYREGVSLGEVKDLHVLFGFRLYYDWWAFLAIEGGVGFSWAYPPLSHYDERGLTLGAFIRFVPVGFAFKKQGSSYNFMVEPILELGAAFRSREMDNYLHRYFGGGLRLNLRLFHHLELYLGATAVHIDESWWKKDNPRTGVHLFGGVRGRFCLNSDCGSSKTKKAPVAEPPPPRVFTIPANQPAPHNTDIDRKKDLQTMASQACSGDKDCDGVIDAIDMCDTSPSTKENDKWDKAAKKEGRDGCVDDGWGAKLLKKVVAGLKENGHKPIESPAVEDDKVVTMGTWKKRDKSKLNHCAKAAFRNQLPYPHTMLVKFVLTDEAKLDKISLEKAYVNDKYSNPVFDTCIKDILGKWVLKDRPTELYWHFPNFINPKN